MLANIKELPGNTQKFSKVKDCRINYNLRYVRQMSFKINVKSFY